MKMKLIPIALLLAAVSAPAALRAQTASPEPAADLADTLRAVDMTAVDALPSLADRAEVARMVAALYPESLKASGASGTVRVRFVVDARGRALAPRVAEESGHAALDSAALRAAEGMRFVPARRGGEPQPVWVELPITFTAPAPAPVAESAPAAGAAAEAELSAEMVKAWADSAGALGPSEVERRPELRNPGEAIRTLRDAYPPALRAARVGGTATVWFVVDRQGTPKGARVAASAGNAELDAAALGAVARLRFDPARNGGAPVDSWMTLPVAFDPPGDFVGTGAGKRPAGPDSLGVYEMADVAELPELINRSAVASEIGRVYPASLRDRGITGMVHLEFVVDVEGGTRDVRVLRSSSVDFTAASVLVVGKMRFRPARVGGRPVPVRVVLPIRFELATVPPPGPPRATPPPMGRQRDPSWPE